MTEDEIQKILRDEATIEEVSQAVEKLARERHGELARIRGVRSPIDFDQIFGDGEEAQK